MMRALSVAFFRTVFANCHRLDHVLARRGLPTGEPGRRPVSMNAFHGCVPKRAISEITAPTFEEERCRRR
jgi:hypothetical protein